MEDGGIRDGMGYVCLQEETEGSKGEGEGVFEGRGCLIPKASLKEG